MGDGSNTQAAITSRGTNAPLTKIGVPKQKMDFQAKIWIFQPLNKLSLLYANHVLISTRQSLANKKVPFSQMIMGPGPFGGVFIGKKWIFDPFFYFQPNIKLAVSPFFLMGPLHCSY